MANKFISTSKQNVGTSTTSIYAVELQGTQTEKQTVIIGCNLSNTTQTAVIAEVSINTARLGRSARVVRNCKTGSIKIKESNAAIKIRKPMIPAAIDGDSQLKRCRENQYIRNPELINTIKIQAEKLVENSRDCDYI